MMPITMASPGERIRIARITGNDKVRAHLHELGFIENDEITVINTIDGNMILKVKDCRVALDKSMARRIMIA